MSNNKGKLSFGRDINEFLQELSPKATAPADDISPDNMFADSSSYSEKIGIFIIEIESKDNGKVKISVSVRGVAGSEEHKFLLLSRLADKLSLSIGEIDGETLSLIEYYADVTRAFSSACASLDYTEGSLRSFERKLINKGFSRDVTADAVALLAETGFVNEAEIAQGRARVFVRKHWGRMRIFAKLREEGFADNSLDGVREYLSEIDFEELCAEHIEKKYGEIPTDRRELEKMYAALSRYGYSSGEIRAAVAILNKK